MVIQSLFCSINSVPPTAAEIEAYAGRLRTLKEQGAKISLVQIYSAFIFQGPRLVRECADALDRLAL